MYQLLLESRVAVASSLAVADGTAFDSAQKTADANQLVILLCEQLETFTDDEQGRITGKIDGQNDDLGMAFLLACYWRLATINIETGAQ